jgi:hypothetical protein
MRQALRSCREPGVGVSETWQSLKQMAEPDLSPPDKPQSARSCCLLPMACNPDPAAWTTHPMTCHPNRSWPWPGYPTTLDPDVVGSGPSPIAGRPNVSRSRCHCLRFNANRWWSSGHDYLASWPRRCHFLRSCRCCHRRWFFRAANQCQWH